MAEFDSVVFSSSWSEVRFSDFYLLKYTGISRNDRFRVNVDTINLQHRFLVL